MLRAFFNLIYFYPIDRIIFYFLYLLSFISSKITIIGYFNLPDNKFKKYVRLSSKSSLKFKKNIHISEYCWIGDGCVLDGSGGIVLGEGVQLAYYVLIFTHGTEDSIRLLGRDYIKYDSKSRPGYRYGSVNIGRYSYIGSGAIILPGITIGEGCIIGANTVVNIDLPDYCIATGSPLKIIGNTIERDHKLHASFGKSKSYYLNNN